MFLIVGQDQEAHVVHDAIVSKKMETENGFVGEKRLGDVLTVHIGELIVAQIEVVERRVGFQHGAQLIGAAPDQVEGEVQHLNAGVVDHLLEKGLQPSRGQVVPAEIQLLEVVFKLDYLIQFQTVLIFNLIVRKIQYLNGLISQYSIDDVLIKQSTSTFLGPNLF